MDFPTINNFSGGGAEIHDLGSNSLSMFESQNHSRFSEYPTTPTPINNNRIDNMLSLRNTDGFVNLLDQYWQQRGTNNGFGRGTNNGLGLGLDGWSSSDLESAMLGLSLSNNNNNRQEPQFPSPAEFEYTQFLLELINTNNSSLAAASPPPDYFGSANLSPAELHRLRIHYPSMKLQSHNYNGGFRYSNSNNGFGFRPRYSSPCSLPSSPSHRGHLVYSSMEQVKGRVCQVAKDQHGGRFLQSKLDDNGKTEEMDMIFSEVMDGLHDLIVHQSGNGLVQKLIEVANPNQLSDILVSVVSNDQKFKEFCIHEHGTRVVQKLVVKLQVPEQQFLVTSTLSRIAVALTYTRNGNHIITKCLHGNSPEVNMPLLDVIVTNCLEIATNSTGCCILQTCINYAASHTPQTGEVKTRLLTEIVENAQLLSEDPFGNYVVQLIITQGILQEIVIKFRGNYVSMSMNRFASNVVERCLAVEKYASMIINEIINSSQFLDVLQDQFGNYVAQRALLVSTGRTHCDLVRHILKHEKSLHSHPYGKKVLEKVRVRASKQQRVHHIY